MYVVCTYQKIYTQQLYTSIHTHAHAHIRSCDVSTWDILLVTSLWYSAMTKLKE